jgi:hypothetical protein
MLLETLLRGLLFFLHFFLALYIREISIPIFFSALSLPLFTAALSLPEFMRSLARNRGKSLLDSGPRLPSSDPAKLPAAFIDKFSHAHVKEEEFFKLKAYA